MVDVNPEVIMEESTKSIKLEEPSGVSDSSCADSRLQRCVKDEPYLESVTIKEEVDGDALESTGNC